MRIAYVFDPILPNRDTDTEQAINTVSALSRNGAEVVLFLPRPFHRPGASGEKLRAYYNVGDRFEVVHLRSMFPSLRGVEKIAHAVRVALHRPVRDFDLVYTRNLPVVTSALACGHRVMYETYRPWPAQYPQTASLFRAAMSHRRFAGAVLHSEYARDRYREIGVPGHLLEVVHNGYEPRLFEPRLSASAAREKLGWTDDRPVAMYAGRVSVGKGLDIVLDMAREHPQTSFVLLGSEGEGEIEKRARTLDNVRIFPWVKYGELPTYLYAADVLLIPPSSIPLSRVGNTVLPMKLFLYLAAGRPILAPASPDTAELLKHGDTAYLTPPDDAAKASAALAEILADPALAGRLGKSAQRLSQKLTWEARGKRLLAFIERQLGQKMAA